jgi:hypothetical protein
MSNEKYYSLTEVCEILQISPDMIYRWENTYQDLKPSDQNRHHYTAWELDLLKYTKKSISIYDDAHDQVSVAIQKWINTHPKPMLREDEEKLFPRRIRYSVQDIWDDDLTKGRFGHSLNHPDFNDPIDEKELEHAFDKQAISPTKANEDDTVMSHHLQNNEDQKPTSQIQAMPPYTQPQNPNQSIPSITQQVIQMPNEYPQHFYMDPKNQATPPAYISPPSFKTDPPYHFHDPQASTHALASQYELGMPTAHPYADNPPNTIAHVNYPPQTSPSYKSSYSNQSTAHPQELPKETTMPKDVQKEDIDTNDILAWKRAFNRSQTELANVKADLSKARETIHLQQNNLKQLTAEFSALKELIRKEIYNLKDLVVDK